ncbi:hypothetical protein Ae406Ps2_6411 [Pseudonocardia sp. Ae406_Ps2]|nr:hypothetical protein Ae406Ps2_6411 [Pseudonocardia sp. Ae406_Ps2]OLM08841.1 hypothetical protein Ae706Ps2_6598c [Pseudonocardia sp. Ae706_Ps2]
MPQNQINTASQALPATSKPYQSRSRPFSGSRRHRLPTLLGPPRAAETPLEPPEMSYMNPSKSEPITSPSGTPPPPTPRRLTTTTETRSPVQDTVTEKAALRRRQEHEELRPAEIPGMIQPRSSGDPQRPQRRSDIQRRNTPGNNRCTSHATTKNLSYAIRKSPAATAHGPLRQSTARTVT